MPPAANPASTPRQKPRTLFINVLVALVALLLVAALAEPVLRLRYAEPVRQTPPVVQEVMPLLRTDPRIGFTWEPNVSADRGILFQNADIVYEALSTDEYGVWNAPEAIARRTSGNAVQVLGLGDSFMEMAAPGFHRAFAAHGSFYYGLAVHRQCPPQYLRWLEQPGIEFKPSVVLVGLFENDFLETEDFDRWTASELDWFAYHSGTWFGPPAITNPLRRFAHTWLRGYTGLANVMRVRLRGERMSVTGPTEAQVARVVESLESMATLAEKHRVALWLVLIPSKPTARGEATPEARAFDRVVDAVKNEMTGVIDLRGVFQTHPDPASLYYHEDGHWNNAGIALAAGTILDRLAIQATAVQDRVVSDESGND